MKRYGQVIRVKAEMLEKYKELHANPWKEINEKIKECNIQNYSIFLDIKLILMTIKIMFMKESTEGFTEEQRKDIQEKE